MSKNKSVRDCHIEVSLVCRVNGVLFINETISTIGNGESTIDTASEALSLLRQHQDDCKIKQTIRRALQNT